MFQGGPLFNDQTGSLLDAHYQRGKNEPLRLGFAMRREVLRMGQVGSEPVCIVERPYIQNHVISANIEEQQDKLIAQMLSDCSARRAISGDVVNCPATRNHGGVYTDAGGGTKREEYEVVVDP